MGDFVFSPCSTICMNIDIQAHSTLEGQQSLYSCSGAVASAVLLLTASAKRNLEADPGICSFQFVFVIKEWNKQTEDQMVRILENH